MTIWTKMKEKYTKLYGLDYYIKERKKHWWSRWEIERFCSLLPYVYVRQKGKFILVTDMKPK